MIIKPVSRWFEQDAFLGSVTLVYLITVINKRDIVNVRVCKYREYLVRTYLHQNFDIVNYRDEIYTREIDCFW